MTPPSTAGLAPPLGRNAPCPCGSGKRYKACHGALFGREDEAQHHDTWTVSARIDLAQGNAAACAARCRAALQEEPLDVAAWNLLGESLRSSNAVEAEAAWRRAVEVDPDNAEAHFHLGNLHRERNLAREAIHEYQHALRAAPGHVGILNNLGLALETMGDWPAAERCYRDVLAIDPVQAEALANLGNMLATNERYKESVDAFDRLFSVRRSVPASVWVQRAIAQQRVGNLASAEASLREAAKLSPDEAKIYVNLGTVLSEQQRFAEADPAWERALELDPENLYALSMLAHGRQTRCDWTGLDQVFAALNRLLESDALSGEKPNPFNVLAMPTSPRARLNASRRWARDLAPETPVPRPDVHIASGERLRIGFVSSDFCEHPTAHLCMEFWERLDRSRISAHAYATRRFDGSAVSVRVRRAFEHYTDVSMESTAEVIRRIRNDRIAIVLDLNGYTHHSREAIFPWRPAPVQINAIGFQGTLGAEWYDYIQVDRFVAPEASQPFFTERFFYMPVMSYPSDTTRALTGSSPSRTQCGLPEQGFVFCSFNNAYKILPNVFAIWMRLLHAEPDGVLWLLETSVDQKHNLHREAARAGIDSNRLIFAPNVPLKEHLARHAAADLFLDTYPYGAHTTANDALLAGLPLVTCIGDTLTSRIGGGHLHALGLSQLITTDFASYEATALRLARHPDELDALRAELVRRRHTHALFDMARYTRDFEDGMMQLWRDYVERKSVD